MEILRGELGGNLLALGFSDQTHFIRHFKRAMGVTPRSYATV
jgi:AraC-like DNA-binding protein